MTTTRVTVVIPSFNHRQFVAEAVESVLSQAMSDLELIVIDDGSSDQSADVIRRAVAGDSRARLIARENRGLSATLAEGLQLSRSPYFAYLGSDDVWESGKLASQLSSDFGPSVGASYSDVWIIDEGGRRIGRKGTSRHYRGGDIYRDLVLFRLQPPSPSNLFLREALLDAGGFAADLALEDHDLWVRLARRWKVAYVDTPLASLRVHRSNTTLVNPSVIIDSNRRTVERALAADPEIRPLERRIWSRYHAVNAALYHSLLDLPAARQSALQALARNPFEPAAWSILLRSAAGRTILRSLRALRARIWG